MQQLTLVTGGGRGLGASICRRLADEGHNLIIGYHDNQTAAEAVAQEVRQRGQEGIAIAVDITEEASIAQLFNQISTFGQLTGLVNNAGAVVAVGDLADNNAANIRRDIEVNLIGPILVAKYAVSVMKQHGGGAIVNISSAAATIGSPNTYVHYAAAKAGIDALTIGLSKEVAAHGIRVNTVSPGVLMTDFHQDPERPAKLSASIPLGRAGNSDEISGAVAWLLSEDAGYTTGANLRVAGGL